MNRSVWQDDEFCQLYGQVGKDDTAWSVVDQTCESDRVLHVAGGIAQRALQMAMGKPMARMSGLLRKTWCRARTWSNMWRNEKFRSGLTCGG